MSAMFYIFNRLAASQAGPRDNELWYLTGETGAKPVKPGVKVSQGYGHLEEEHEGLVRRPLAAGPETGGS